MDTDTQPLFLRMLTAVCEWLHLQWLLDLFTHEIELEHPYDHDNFE